MQKIGVGELQIAKIHYLANCMLNIAKGISNILAGHLTDSTIYARKTVESVRYASFMRDRPDIIELWRDLQKRKNFENEFKAWWNKAGKNLLNVEFPQSEEHYKYASVYGSHSNLFLFLQQHAELDGNFRIYYQDIDETEKGYNTLLATYMWHLWVHSNALTWWIEKSGLRNVFTKEQLRYFFESHRAIARDFMMVEEMVKKTHKMEKIKF